MSSTPRRFLVPLAALAAALCLAGCTSLAEDVSKHLLANDLKKIEHDHCVFERDLALFRGCLKTRGGACEGDATTPLPHSTQHAAGQPHPGDRDGAPQ